jgi:hypothetical protein
MAKRDFKRERLALDGLVWSTGVLVVAGVLSLFAGVFEEAGPALQSACIVGFTGMALCSLFVAQAAAACAQILSGEEHAASRGWAFFCAVVTGLVSVAGVYLGDSILRGGHPELPPLPAMIAGAFCLAFVKPTMSFVITACETKLGLEERAHDALLEERDRRIRELEAELRKTRSQPEKPFAANDEELPQPAPRRASPANARHIARAVRSARMSASTKAAVEERRPADRAPPLSEEAVAEILAKMADAGIKGELISLNAVRKFAEVPYSRIERSPGRHLIEAAAKKAA